MSDPHISPFFSSRTLVTTSALVSYVSELRHRDPSPRARSVGGGVGSPPGNRIPFLHHRRLRLRRRRRRLLRLRRVSPSSSAHSWHVLFSLLPFLARKAVGRD